MPVTADRSVAEEIGRLIDESPSPYHATATAAGLLRTAGFDEVQATDGWEDGHGGRFLRRGGALIAWIQPSDVPARFRVIGAHTDSPNLRVKPRPDRVSAGVRQLGVEVYGGALLNSWLDRDLGLSGRVVVSGAEGARTVLFRIDEPILRVPQLAIHLDREISTEGLKLNKQEHMTPIWDLEGDAGSTATFLDTVAEAADLDPATIVSWDAMVHDLTPSRRTGRNGVFLSAPRLDNLCSSFAAVLGLVDVGNAQDPPRGVPVVVLYDHEEVGSTSATGADGALLAATLERIVALSGGDRDDLLRALPASTCLSADMAHGTHPNYVDRHEPDHQVFLNGGPVVKVNASQRYASDAESVATYLQACDDAGVPTQRFVGRNDLPCGSTIGPVTAARLGMPTVDVGVAQLAMHSARELCGADDPGWYRASMASFLQG